jgi:GWxTD domain-containing protein
MIRRTIRGRAAGGAVLLGLLGSGLSPSPRAGEPLPLFVDAASFPLPGGGNLTRLYLALPLGLAPRVRPPWDLYVTVSLEGEEDLERDWVYKALTAEQLSREAGAPVFRARYGFTLPPGKVKARVRVEELDSESVGEAELEFRVRDQDGAGLAVSDPVFGRCGEETPAAGEEHREGPLLPHPSRRYGDPAPDPCVLMRILDRLPEVPDTVYAVGFRVSGDGGSREEGTTWVSRSEGWGELLLPLPISGLGHGRYEVRVEVGLGEEKVVREADFAVDESRISVSGDVRRLRAVLGYVATSRELTVLDNTPDDSLLAFWQDFWARRDPSPGSEANEALAEFMERVEYATRHFGDLEPGWDSDMGRIYIRYGPPDRIEEDRGDSRFPTQIWYYYERSASLVFHDVDGLGRYRLAGHRRR